MIDNFKLKFEALQYFTQTVLPDNVKLHITWKIHCLVVHLPQFLRRGKVGMRIFADRTAEAVHHDFIRTEKRFLVDETHTNHAQQLERAVVEYYS